MAILRHPKRGAVFNALFDLVVTTTPPIDTSWKLTSQRVRLWDEVDSVNQPALFLMRGPQRAEQKKAYGVTKWLWRAGIIVYYRVDGLKTENTYPDQLSDQFLDNLESVFQTDEGVALTIGGLVEHCWIDGECFTEPGLVDGQAIIFVPVSIYL